MPLSSSGGQQQAAPQRRQQDLPAVVEPELGAGDLDVPDFLK